MSTPTEELWERVLDFLNENNVEGARSTRTALATLRERFGAVERVCSESQNRMTEFAARAEAAERERDDMQQATASHWSEFEHRLKRAEAAEAHVDALNESLTAAQVAHRDAERERDEAKRWVPELEALVQNLVGTLRFYAIEGNTDMGLAPEVPFLPPTRRRRGSEQ